MAIMVDMVTSVEMAILVKMAISTKMEIWVEMAIFVDMGVELRSQIYTLRGTRPRRTMRHTHIPAEHKGNTTVDIRCYDRRADIAPALKWMRTPTITGCFGHFCDVFSTP